MLLLEHRMHQLMLRVLVQSEKAKRDCDGEMVEPVHELVWDMTTLLLADSIPDPAKLFLLKCDVGSDATKMGAAVRCEERAAVEATNIASMSEADVDGLLTNAAGGGRVEALALAKKALVWMRHKSAWLDSLGCAVGRPKNDDACAATGLAVRGGQEDDAGMDEGDEDQDGEGEEGDKNENMDENGEGKGEGKDEEENKDEDEDDEDDDDEGDEDDEDEGDEEGNRNEDDDEEEKEGHASKWMVIGIPTRNNI
jgi:hypothetical protein